MSEHEDRETFEAWWQGDLMDQRSTNPFQRFTHGRLGKPTKEKSC